MEDLVKKQIKQVLKGNQNAYGKIVEIYKDKVFQISYRMLGNVHEAEDIAQEAFIRAYTNIHKYHLDKKFSTWLYRITTNLTIDRIRKRKPDYYLDSPIDGDEGMTMYSLIPSENDSPDQEIITLEKKESIQKEILALPAKYRSAIVLKYLEDLSLKEISEILDLPIGTVKTRIHRGREALRKRFAERKEGM